MVKSISSHSNPTIRNIVSLIDKPKARKEQQKFVVEGRREVSMALHAGYEVELLVFNPTIVTYNELHELLGNQIFEIQLIEVTNLIYNRLAYREGTEGVVGVFKSKSLSLNNLEMSHKNPLILVAEAPEKPGNIGALLRTADSAGVDAVIIADGHTDLYNPNVIRGSIGTVFTNNIAIDTSENVLKYLKSNNIQIFSAFIDPTAVSCYECSFVESTAFVVGTESTGLSSIWTGEASKKIMIPMQGKIDSLNVSVSASILIFEAVRQRLLINK